MKKCMAYVEAVAKTLLGSTLLVVMGCKHEPTTPASVPPPAVDVSKPIVQEIVEEDEYTGRLGPVESVDVRARVGGYVDSVNFTDGQIVKKGDLLFVIDPRPYQAALKVAQGEALESQSHAEIAQNDLSRAKVLSDTRSISQEEVDRRNKTADAAQASLQTARARAERAQLDVEFTEVRAPMDGRISRHLVSVGNLVAGGTSDSTLLANIVTVGAIYAYFDIDEQAYLKYLRVSGDQSAKVFKNTSEVELALLGDTDFTQKGELDFVDNQIDQATGTLRARAIFKNDALMLSPGVFVKIRVAGSPLEKAILVPDRAVQADQSDRFVLVVGADNVVKAKRVSLGRLFRGFRIVTKGLDGSESVVVDGVQRARPDSQVAPTQTELSLPQPTIVSATQPQSTSGKDAH